MTEPWPRSRGRPEVGAVIRRRAADFRVQEQMHHALSGNGEHFWVQVRKEGLNTADVAGWLADRAGVPRRAVGFSGLKDRHAVTEQWFSIHLPGRPDPVLRDTPAGVSVLASGRHYRKLNRGTHRGNRFQLVLRDLRGDAQVLEARLREVARAGVPNYFGPQRFGRSGGNWQRGRAWLTGEGEAPRQRSLRGLWLSAVRSYLFNQVLAERVRQGCWNRALPGDILQPEGSRGLFHEEDEPRASERVAAGEVHPTAPLPGREGMASSRACRDLEQAVLAPFSAEIAGLEREDVEAARRATRMRVDELQWALEGDTLTLAFSLPAGAFATAVLDELAVVEDEGPDSRPSG